MNAKYRASFCACFFAALLISGLRAAYADPILLAQYFETQRSAETFHGILTAPITTVDLNVILNASSSGPLLGLYNNQNSTNYDPYSTGLPTSIDTIGTVEFTDNNAPGFESLVNRLEGSVNEFVEFENYELESNGDGTGGSGDGGPESKVFGGLLTGDSIDFITATILEENFIQGTNSYSYAPQITWQFWGDGQPTPSAFWTSTPPFSTPEPSSLALFGCGLMGLGITILRRRRQGLSLDRSEKSDSFTRTATGNYGSKGNTSVNAKHYHRLPSTVALVCAFFAVPPAYGGGVPGVPNYAVTPLGVYTSGTAINNSGQITGYYFPTENETAFLYSNGTLQDLGTLGGYTSYGYGINNNGQVTGVANLPPSGVVDGPSHAFIYSNGSMQDIGCLDSANNYCFSTGYAINDSGQVTGSTDVANNYFGHAFLYSDGHMQDLGCLGSGPSCGSVGYGINGSGEVTGVSQTASGLVQAFIYSNGVMHDIGGFGGQNPVSYGYGINNSGEVTGFANTATGDRAFLYADGSMQDLGDLKAGPSGRSEGYAINDSGEVTGWSDTYAFGPETQHAFLYTDDQMIDLNSLIGSAEASLYTMTSGQGINDSGQIVVDGIINASGQREAFLLTPIPGSYATPEAGSLGLFALGLTVLGLALRRRASRLH